MASTEQANAAQGSGDQSTRQELAMTALDLSPWCQDCCIGTDKNETLEGFFDEWRENQEAEDDEKVNQEGLMYLTNHPMGLSMLSKRWCDLIKEWDKDEESSNNSSVLTMNVMTMRKCYTYPIEHGVGTCTREANAVGEEQKAPEGVQPPTP